MKRILLAALVFASGGAHAQVSFQPNYGSSGNAVVSGTKTATGASAWFRPIYGRDFNVWIWGTYAATCQIERSFDAGATASFPITAAGTQLYVWSTANATVSETLSESEYGVSYRLNCTAYTSGTVNYRISQ